VQIRAMAGSSRSTDANAVAGKCPRVNKVA